MESSTWPWQDMRQAVRRPGVQRGGVLQGGFVLPGGAPRPAGRPAQGAPPHLYACDRNALAQGVHLPYIACIGANIIHLPFTELTVAGLPAGLTCRHALRRSKHVPFPTGRAARLVLEARVHHARVVDLLG